MYFIVHCTYYYIPEYINVQSYMHTYNLILCTMLLSMYVLHVVCIPDYYLYFKIYKSINYIVCILFKKKFARRKAIIIWYVIFHFLFRFSFCILFFSLCFILTMFYVYCHSGRPMIRFKGWMVNYF